MSVDFQYYFGIYFTTSLCRKVYIVIKNKTSQKCSKIHKKSRNVKILYHY